MSGNRVLELSDNDLDQVSGGVSMMDSSQLTLDSAGIMPDGSFTPREYQHKSFEEAKQDVSNSRGQPTGGWNTVRDPII